MRGPLERVVLSLLAVLLFSSVGSAQWPDDPALNLVIADRASEQVVPKVAATPDGGCYVGWFDLASGNYDVYLQRLDAAGNEAWRHNGVLVSDNPQDTWLVDWDLISDDAGNAVLVFSDIRSGGDLDVYAYKVSPDGQMLWGLDGIALSDNADFEPAPMVTQTTDGDFVFVWARMPDAGSGHILMQRVSRAGELRFAAGGIPVAGQPGESPGFCELVPDAAGGVIVSWVRDMSQYMSPRHLWAERFDSHGASVWGAPVVVYSTFSLPLGYVPEIQSDGAGGALLLWHRSDGNYYNSFVQHLDPDGNPLLPAGGLAVSTVAGMHHIAPTMALDEVSGDIYVFWDERNSNQSQWGIFGQRITPGGVRAWGNAGRSFLPTSTLYKWAYRALPAPGGAICFWIDEPGGYDQDRIRGFRVDSAGLYVWEDSPIVVSSTLSGKSRLPVAETPGGTAILIWEDNRSGTVDVYGQNVNDDGSLGPGVTAVCLEPREDQSLRVSSLPNPFNPATTIRFETAEAGPVRLAVFDAQGRRVVSLIEASLEAGPHDVTWSGQDDGGRPVASGVYYGLLVADGRARSWPMVLVR